MERKKLGEWGEVAFSMKWWRQKHSKRSVEPAGRIENVLVISDIHLGEDILIEGPEHLGDYIRMLNRELARFISAHANQRLDGRDWHLVINGDMFDFLKVSLRPEEESQQTHLSIQDKNCLPNTSENVVWKLKRILEIHRPLFKELALFLLKGHRITLVEGNHDAEFYFPEVRQTLQNELMRLCHVHCNVHQEGSSREDVKGFLHLKTSGKAIHADEKKFNTAWIQQRVQFRSWFEASPGRYHIEHGHQYDEFCSFEYPLAPYDTPSSNHIQDPTLATPFSHRPMPYMAEMLGDFSTHGVHSWRLGRMMRFVLTLGPQVVLKLVRLYVRLGYELLRRGGRKRRVEMEAWARKHDEKLRALSKQSVYGLTTLERLDRLKALPAEYSLWKIAHIFYLDRALVFAGTGVAIGMAWVLGSGWRAMGLIAGVGGVLLWGFSSMRRLDVSVVLRKAAAHVSQETGAPYVIFGHSHVPEVVNLHTTFGISRFGEARYYINSGSWVTREILRGHAGVGMTYVEISQQGAALKRWCGSEQPPAVLDHTYEEEEKNPTQSKRSWMGA